MRFTLGFHAGIQVGVSQDKQLDQELGSAPMSFTLAVGFMLRSNVVNLTSHDQLEEVIR